MLFALLAAALIVLIGMGIDYSMLARLKSKMDAAAAAAALAAVTPAMMAEPGSASIAAAKNAFGAQTAGLPRLIFSPGDLKVSISYAGLTRNVSVAYSAALRSYFAGIFNMAALPFAGSATASATTAPNIDFYLLLDTSPSMAIAGTPIGIMKMTRATFAQGGCAFACHQANPAADNLRNPGGEDNYALARRLGVTLRIDLLDAAITDLTNTAYAAQTNAGAAANPVYRMSINAFDVSFNPLIPLTPNYVSAWSAQLSAMKANNTQFLEVYQNDQACSATTTMVNGVTTTNPCGAGAPNSDADTKYDAAMEGITTLMPPPGTGTNRAGDTPQETLIVLTDGVEDENVSGGRQQSTMTGVKDWCTPLKAKGIKIAVLYTEYFPLPTNDWYKIHIAPFQPDIAPTLENCASPGLIFKVGVGQNISAALWDLFRSAVASAHLTQ